MKLVSESLSDHLKGPSEDEIQRIKKKIHKESKEIRKDLEEYENKSIDEIAQDIKDDIIMRFGIIGPFDDERILRGSAKETKSDIRYILDNFEDFTISCYPHIEWCKNNLLDAVRAYANTGDALDYKK